MASFRFIFAALASYGDRIVHRFETPFPGRLLVLTVVALTYTNALYAAEDVFDRLPVGDVTKPALGGLYLGVLALSVPLVHATGYPVIQDALVGTFSLEVVLAFGVAKIVATSLTLGNGGSGGIFAPALFIGAMMGSADGTVLRWVKFPIGGNYQGYFGDRARPLE